MWFITLWQSQIVKLFSLIVNGSILAVIPSIYHIFFYMYLIFLCHGHVQHKLVSKRGKPYCTIALHRHSLECLAFFYSSSLQVYDAFLSIHFYSFVYLASIHFFFARTS